jgi:hypothetical protein
MHVSSSSSSSVAEYLHISDSRKGVMILPYLRYVLRTFYVGRTKREPHNIAALGGYQAVQPTITHKLDNRLITNPNHGITPSVGTDLKACRTLATTDSNSAKGIPATLAVFCCSHPLV